MGLDNLFKNTITEETEFTCPLDNTNLVYIKTNFDDGEWIRYTCPTCRAEYKRTDKEYLKQKSEEYFKLLIQLQEIHIKKSEEIRGIINKILEIRKFI